ncbi:DUF3881 family protein [[Clostridium] polysaccharolyticum]|uniref:Uncharacterized protein n=1 Tax=[Clostridium] polysaccharolyticum TaxID=29364 RepID=A0A1I0F3Q0_9FIRM|nr:DUF3881 family protein [[Clostridium] polysaccharolyticum]SET52667.1 protein of unknown function [[Clostridium] polysaccharolyticum]
MHSYLRAVGFSNVKSRTELDKILGQIMDRPNEKRMNKVNETTTLTEMKLDFAPNMGVAIRGEYDEKGFFHLDHYFPYFKGARTSIKEEVCINKRIDTEAYTGMCDDVRLGVSLIFYLQNGMECVQHNYTSSRAGRYLEVTLSALSVQGMVLLGMSVSKKKQEAMAAEIKMRRELIAEAKMGNQEAIDSLTIDDIDMYAMISRRSKSEDIYSIVESSFIPYGSESDNYTIIGTILECDLIVNGMSGEQVYNLLINCNDLIYNVCINKLDLLGEPKPGRRFKGNIWMQGYANIPTWE